MSTLVVSFAKRKPKKPCTCVKNSLIVDAEIDKVVKALVAYAILSASEQLRTVAEWMRYASCYNNNDKRNYVLPGTFIRVCHHAIARLIGKKGGAWSFLFNKVKNEIP